MASLLAAIALAGTAGAAAQEPAGGRIQGKIVDSETGEPLVGAEVYVQGTQLGALSDLDGNYRITAVPRGVQAVRVLYLGYAEKTVTGVEVSAGGETTLDVAMVPEALVAEGVTVEVTAVEERGSVEGALAFQRSSTNVVNGVSAQEIRRTPDSNAAEAVTRVSSASLVDGRYVYVRGLGERYSTALLDGAALPTPEPEKRVVPLDLFPTSIIESVFTLKSFTADLPGDFAGGLVSIQTKDIPEERFLRLNVGAGYNSNLSDLDPVTYEGGDTDWLGFDDGTRGLPGDLPDVLDRTAARDEVGRLHSLFEGDFRTFTEEPDLGYVNKALGLSFGSPSRLFGKDGGYFVALNYGYNANSREQKEFFPALAADLFRYDFDTRIGSREVSTGLLAGYGVDLSPSDRISLKLLGSRSTEDEARIVTGPFDLSTSGFARITRMQFVERTLLNGQLKGDHKVGWVGDARLDWDVSYGLALRDEPDTRQTFFVRQSEDSPFFFNETGNNGRFFSDLTDHLGQAGAKLSTRFPFLGRDAVLDTGLRGLYRTRDFQARRFSYNNASPEGRTLPPEQLFTSERIAAGDVSFTERTEPNDEYDARELQAAAFASLDVGLGDAVRMTAGLRVEQSDTDVESFDPLSGREIEPLSASLEALEPMPSLALRWELGENQIVHASAARTIVRPQFRELAPFRYDTYLESSLGNPFLENGEIYNLDLRWSLFPRLGEILSVGAFYKHFNDPIEIVRIPTAGNAVGTPEPYNGPAARTYGVEVELRQDLRNWTAALSGLGFAANVALADSRVDQDEPVEVFFGQSTASGPDVLDPEVFTNRERPLVNQSDFLVNAMLYYASAATGTTGTLLYNGVGERLTQVGTIGFEDIYEQARHTFDVTVEQPFGAATLKLAVENLTDEPYEFRIGEDTHLRYAAGRQFSLSAAYAF